jgi:hypothetical protein
LFQALRFHPKIANRAAYDNLPRAVHPLHLLLRNEIDSPTGQISRARSDDTTARARETLFLQGLLDESHLLDEGGSFLRLLQLEGGLYFFHLDVRLDPDGMGGIVITLRASTATPIVLNAESPAPPMTPPGMRQAVRWIRAYALLTLRGNPLVTRIKSRA